VSYSRDGEPSTVLDCEINRVILERLPMDSEGWLSEEGQDNLDRLRASRVWVVDPIDGTRQFVEGIPEWCVSIGLVEENEAVAGGVLNPSTGEMFLGAKGIGFEVSGPVPSRCRRENEGVPRMLVSRREYHDGKWQRFHRSDVAVIPVGSIAYRLAQVAAGYADATCTFESRSEWDVAGGVALIAAAGGSAKAYDGTVVRFNQENPRLQTFFAFGKDCPTSLPKLCGLHENQLG
jgi:myo-inositol-1(or 4)-monophosphatase